VRGLQFFQDDGAYRLAQAVAAECCIREVSLAVTGPQARPLTAPCFAPRPAAHHSTTTENLGDASNVLYDAGLHVTMTGRRDTSMDVQGANLLSTLAGLIVTFAALSAILLGIRVASGTRLSMFDRLVARILMSHLFLLAAGALLPQLLVLSEIPETWIWRASALVCGGPLLWSLLTLPHRRRQLVGAPLPPMVFAFVVVLGSAVLAAMVVYVFTNSKHLAAAYIAALIVNFFTTVFSFLVALDTVVQQHMDTR
jgi:hypothetical protein